MKLDYLRPGNLMFIYRDEFGLNDLLMETRKFIDGERYAFGDMLNGACNLYGIFSEGVFFLNDNMPHEYYTSHYITEEQYAIIRLVCTDEGWLSMK